MKKIITTVLFICAILASAFSQEKYLKVYSNDTVLFSRELSLIDSVKVEFGDIPEWEFDISGSYILIFEDPDTIYTGKESYTIGTDSYEGYPVEITVSATDTGYSAFVTVFEGQPAFELAFRKQDTTYNIISDDNARGEVQYGDVMCPYYQKAFGIEIDETALNNGNIVYKRDAATGYLKTYGFKELWLNYIVNDGVLSGVYYFTATASQGQRIVCVPAIGALVEYQGKSYIYDRLILPQFVPRELFDSPANKAPRPLNTVKYKGEIKEAQFVPKEILKNDVIRKISKRK
ncbi:MAG: hypothetical protein LBG17_07440 [Bacteroidales bacterium]|jgi:hypothetical protein|nr:hypothetical protein [Bacteroidales bacterium]